jgi:RNA polymerase sigma factor (sigma-70 family)
MAHVVVMDVEHLVASARAGSIPAFGELVRRYQGMALAYAFSLLRDLPLAQDAAQEAFVAAYMALGQLAEPRAFPGWLRAVVRTQCGRIVRRRRVDVVPIDAAANLPGGDEPPDERVARDEVRAHVLAAVAGLPSKHREILLLFYVEQHSQREVAEFLGVPVTTVNMRLHAARRALRDRILRMVREALRAGALPDDFPERIADLVRPAPEPAGRTRTFVPAAHLPVGFVPHPDPARCACHRLAWPCPRCAALEGVDPSPPPTWMLE